VWMKLGTSVLVVVGCSASTAQISADWKGGLQAEGYSSPAPDQVASLHHRILTTTSTICQEVVELPASFESSPSRIVTKTGGTFSLDDLVLRAIGSAGDFLASSPITVSVYYEPGVLSRVVSQEREFRGSGIGNGVVVIQGACGKGDPPVRLEVPVIVEG
jgi:hypothetical protein